MTRSKAVTIYLPRETWEEYRDALIQELGKREYQSRQGAVGTYSRNNAIAESLFQDAILPYLGEVVHSNPNVEPTEEGTLEEVAQPRDDDGNFTSNN